MGDKKYKARLDCLGFKVNTVGPAVHLEATIGLVYL
jgi:hypothetical protein